MNEFNNRVDAQRQLLKIVNDRVKGKEELFSMSQKGIARWTAVNGIDTSSRLVQLLDSASRRIFVMANLSDDPIASEYRMNQDEVIRIGHTIAQFADDCA